MVIVYSPWNFPNLTEVSHGYCLLTTKLSNSNSSFSWLLSTVYSPPNFPTLTVVSHGYCLLSTHHQISNSDSRFSWLLFTVYSPQNFPTLTFFLMVIVYCLLTTKLSNSDSSFSWLLFTIYSPSNFPTLTVVSHGYCLLSTHHQTFQLWQQFLMVIVYCLSTTKLSNSDSSFSWLLSTVYLPPNFPTLTAVSHGYCLLSTHHKTFQLWQFFSHGYCLLSTQHQTFQLWQQFLMVTVYCLLTTKLSNSDSSFSWLLSTVYSPQNFPTLTVFLMVIVYSPPNFPTLTAVSHGYCLLSTHHQTFQLWQQFLVVIVYSPPKLSNSDSSFSWSLSTVYSPPNFPTLTVVSHGYCLLSTHHQTFQLWQQFLSHG